MTREGDQMDYLKIAEEFSGKYPDYKNDVWNFNQYLEKQWKNSLSDENIRFLLQGLNVDFLLDSLIFNVEERKIYKRKNAAKKYATVIGIFLIISVKIQIYKTRHFFKLSHLIDRVKMCI